VSQELDEFIKNHQGYIIIQFHEIHEDQESEVDMVLKRIESENINAMRLVQLAGEGFREWIRKWEIYGSPAILFFLNGELLLRIRGQITAQKLVKILNERVFLSDTYKVSGI